MLRYWRVVKTGSYAICSGLCEPLKDIQRIFRVVAAYYFTRYFLVQYPTNSTTLYIKRIVEGRVLFNISVNVSADPVCELCGKCLFSALAPNFCSSFEIRLSFRCSEYKRFINSSSMYSCFTKTHVDGSNESKRCTSALEHSFYDPPCLNVVLACPSKQNTSSGRTPSQERGDHLQSDVCCLYLSYKRMIAMYETL